MAAKCPHCGGEATLEAIRAANGRCPACGRGLKVKFTGAPRPVEHGPAKPPAEGLRKSLESIGPYEILSEISRGGMGIVYKARDKNLKKTLAIKVLLRGEEASSDELKRFRREAEAAAKLQHSNIVPIHAVGVCQGLHYFVMDFIEGESLSALIERGGIAPRQSLDYVEQLADALAYAHAAGVIHRDIKPANVMIDRFGRPQLMDFGLAKEVGSETQLTQVGTTMGTPTYMPPEQAEGDLAGIDAQSDVYSLGAVLYEMLTGAPPFEGPTTMSILMKVLEEEPPRPRRLNPRIHPDVEAICLKAMAKEKPDRYRSAAEFREDVRRFKAGEMIEAARSAGSRAFWRFLRRHAQALTALVAGALVLGGLGVWKAWSDRQARIRLAEEGRREIARLLEQAAEALKPEPLTDDDLQKAGELYRRVADLAPKEPEALRGMERIRAIRRQRLIDYYLQRAQHYLKTENYEAAKDMFGLILKNDAANPEALAGLRRAEGTGRITITSRPVGATVYLAEAKDKDRPPAEPEPAAGVEPGRKLGVTPLKGVDIPMSERGPHRLTLVKEGCGWQSIPVQVGRNQDVPPIDVELFDVRLAGGDLRAVSNLVRVGAGTVRLDDGTDAEVKEFLIDRYEGPNRLGVPPRRGLGWGEAAAQAAKEHKRLPTRAEWLLAAGGPKGLDFPYGDTFDPARAVTGRAFDEGPLPCGSRPGDCSPWGIYDLSGNVSEWAVAPGEEAPEDLRGFHEACGGNWTSVQPFSSSSRAAVAYEVGETPQVVGFRSIFVPAGDKLPSAPEARPEAAREAGDVVLKACPPDMVEIRTRPGTPAFELVNYPFCIDRYEYPNKENQPPRARVTWEEADRLARGLGRRLPTRNEWRVACGGDDLWKYPFGDEYVPGRAPVELSQKEPVLSGSMPGSKSPFGVFDLSGNLAEWLWSGQAGAGGCGGVAGGCWFSVRENAASGSWVDQKPGEKGPTIGFRCAARLEK